MLAHGRIVGVKDEGIYILVPADKEKIKDCLKEVTVEFDDGRNVTSAQRRKAHVLLRYIADWTGYTPLEAMKEMTKFIFHGTGITLKDEMFSLADCDRTTARLYITYLIDFVLLHGIDCGEPLYSLCEDIPKYIWACLMNKRCAVCGKKAELHHVDAVGMGRNRKEICHIGMKALPLCRIHHNEIHNIGKVDFCKRYILEPLPIDERIAEVYKLKK